MGLASDFVLVVLAGLLGGMLARALRMPLLVGYVLAGVAVGPYTMGPTVAQIHDIETLAEVGVALLLFSIGLEVSFRDLLAVRRITLAGGPLQIAVTIAAAAWLAAHLLGMSTNEALWFGSMVSISSTMVVLKVLSAAGMMTTLASRVMIGLLVAQDLAVIPLLIALPQLTGGGLSWRLPLSLAISGGVILAVYFTGARLLPRLLRAILAWGSRELFLVAVVATGVGIGAGMHAAGISFALGAFIAGLILSESELSHQALSDVVPLRDIFGLLFFVSAGMLFNPRYALEHALTVVLTVCVILAGKALVLGLITRAFGYGNLAPWIVGLGLSQVGEFSFVLARAGLNGGHIGKPVYDLALTATVLSMAIAPLASSLAVPLGRRWQSWFGALPAAANRGLPRTEMSGHAVIAGFGRAGRTVAAALRQAGVPSVIVESNYALLGSLEADGYQGLWGDATQAQILHAARIEAARLLVLTIPEGDAVELALARARQMNPAIQVVARAASANQIAHLAHHGATEAIVAEFEGGVEMARQSLGLLGENTAAVEGIVRGLRATIYDEAG